MRIGKVRNVEGKGCHKGRSFMVSSRFELHTDDVYLIRTVWTHDLQTVFESES
jgi:hypothetical protein